MFKRFEAIEAWQLAREISKEVYRFSKSGGFAKDFKLRDQARASAGSMTDNISEGFGRGSKNEFVQFLTIGKGSAEELKSQLYRVVDNGCISQAEFDLLYSKTEKYCKMVGGLMSYLNESEIKGQKFRNRV